MSRRSRYSLIVFPEYDLLVLVVSGSSDVASDVEGFVGLMSARVYGIKGSALACTAASMAG